MSVFAISRAFAAARDSRWAARSSRTGDEGQRRAAGLAQAQERRWTMSGKRYLKAYKGLNGQLIRFPAELLNLVEQQIEAIAPPLAAAFDGRLGRLAFDAWREWPEATGLSRSLIDIEYEQRDTTFIGRVVSRAPYTVFIKSKGGVSPYQNLLRKPGRAVARQIAADLAGEGV